MVSSSLDSSANSLLVGDWRRGGREGGREGGEEGEGGGGGKEEGIRLLML